MAVVCRRGRTRGPTPTRVVPEVGATPEDPPSYTPLVLTLEPIAIDPGPLRYFGGFDFTRDARTLVVGHFFGKDRALTAWDTVSWTRRWSTAIRETPSEVVVARDARWVATLRDTPVWLWDLDTGAPIGTIGASASLWRPLVALPQERLIVGERPGTAPTSLSVWHAPGGELLGRFCASPAGFFPSIALDSACTRVAAHSQLHTLSLWDFSSGKQVHDFGGAHPASPPRDPGGAMPLLFHPEGDRVIVGGLVDAPGPAVFDASTGRRLGHLPGPELQSPATALAVSPCGRWLVGAYGWQEDDHWPWQDLALRVWDLRTGQLVQHLPVLVHPAGRLLFSSDGSLLVAGSTDGLQVWSVTAR